MCVPSWGIPRNIQTVTISNKEPLRHLPFIAPPQETTDLFSPVFRTGGQTKNPCACVVSHVFSGARRKMRKLVCMCRFARVFRSETKTLKLAEKCVCVASCLFSGPRRKTEKSVCVCVSPRACFQGPGEKRGNPCVCVSPRACFQGPGEKRGNPCVCRLVCVCVCVWVARGGYPTTAQK